MPAHSSFRLRRSGVCLALISLAFAGEAAAATGGRVDFATGGATVAGSDGQPRPLARGVELGTGDTVRTDAAGRAQIRFTDGSYVSLQPNTEFAIKDYNFEGKTDGSERGFFGLAKGAMRTVTGLVGRVNRNKYQIVTPTATVGIRGTGGRIEVLLDGSTLIAGTSGIWTLTNPSGTLDVPAGTFGKAPSAPNQPPQQTSQGPTTGPAPLPVDSPKPVEVRGVDEKIDSACQSNPAAAACRNSIGVNPTPAPTPLPTPLPTPVQPLLSGGGYAAAVAYNPPSSGASADAQSGLDATFNGAGQLTNIQTSMSSFGFGFKLEAGGGHGRRPDGTLDFGTDGILAWGRWIGTVTQNCDCSNPQTYDDNQGLHYVVGVPTAVMPTTGNATYSLAGATSPTVVGGNGAPGTVTGGQLVVGFGLGTYSVRIENFNVSIPSINRNYTLNSPDAIFSSSSSLFSLYPTVSGCGSTSCGSNVRGFIAGASAERAGIGYTIYESGPQGNIQVAGAAAFSRSSAIAGR